MKIIFTDLFNRKFFNDPKFLIENIAYDQVGNSSTFNRDKLPSNFMLNGDIYWYNTKIEWHCTTGPGASWITGEISFVIDNVEMTKIEWLLAIEK